MASTRSVLAAWLLVVAACDGPTPTSSPDPTMASVPSVPGPQPTPTATTSPVPAVATVPPNTPTPYPSGAPYQGQVPETASAEFGGARLTIAVGHNPIDAVFGGSSPSRSTIGASGGSSGGPMAAGATQLSPARRCRPGGTACSTYRPGWRRIATGFAGTSRSTNQSSSTSTGRIHSCIAARGARSSRRVIVSSRAIA